MKSQLIAVCLLCLLTPAFGQDKGPAAPKQPARPQPPTRPFDSPGSPQFTRLDKKPGTNPPADSEGDFLIGPDYLPAPEWKPVDGVPQGKVHQFTINSKHTKLFNPGIARDEFGTVDPKNPKTLIVKTREVDYTRTVTVYIPEQYQPGTEAPFIVIHDGPKGKPDMKMAYLFDNLIAQKRIPVMLAIMVANGGGDAQGHQRGKEYDNMSGMYAEYIETEVLTRVEKNYQVKLTKDPDGRATMGSSSGGSCALIMAWYRPDLYRRVLTTSGTFVNQQWPFDPATPNGAWDFHETLIPKSDRKPLRIFLSVGDRDLLNPNVMRDGMHDWVEANNRMAKVLKAKGYPYQYVYCLNVGHGLGPAKAQILPHALEWLWKDYPAKKEPSDKPISLFNGKDLSGWHVDVPHLDEHPDAKPTFIVRDGMLVSLGEPQGHLITDAKYENYRLEVEYRFAAKPGNCGVLVHASTPRALYKMFPKSIEVQMNHRHAGDFWCIVEDITVPEMVKRRGPKENWGITEGKARRILNLTDDSEKKPGEWNHMVIECLKDEVKVWVNGDLVNHGSNCTATKGQIAIQAEGSEVEFRKLELTPISKLTE